MLAVLASSLVILAPVIWLYPETAIGADTYGHLQRAHFLGENLRTYGLLEGLAQSAWMPDWYLGDPTGVYYPPLTTWLLGPLTALLGDAELAFRVLVTLLLLGFAGSLFHIGARWGQSSSWAIAGALIALTSPYVMRTFFIEGNLARGVALVFLPWLLWNTERILREREISSIFTMLALLWGLCILAHPMQAAIFAILMGVYVLLRLLTNIFVPLRRAVLALLPIFLGAGMVAGYLLPAYSGAELAHVPNLPETKVDQFALPLEALLPLNTPAGFVSVGVVALVLGAYLMFSEVREYHRALLGSALLMILLSLGQKSGVYQLLPFGQLFLPERFVLAGVVPLALIFATVAPSFRKPRFVLLCLVLIIALDALPAWRTLANQPSTTEEQALGELLATQPLAGRVAPLVDPSPSAAHIFFSSATTDRPSTAGWALENTPQQFTVRRLLRGLEGAPAYVERVLALWDVGHVVTNQPAPLPLESFRPVASSGRYRLLARQQRPALAQVLPPGRMLILGENPTEWLFAFPFASEGHSPDPTRYSDLYLAHFSAIGMTRVPSVNAVEQALGDWVAAGGTLIIDLSGAEQLYQQGFSLFGVRAIPFTLEGDYRPRVAPGLAGDVPTRLRFSTPEGPAVGATYYDAAQDLITVQEDGQTYSLLSHQPVGAGQVYFVGFNLIPLLAEQHAAGAAPLVDALLEDVRVDRALRLPTFPMALKADRAAELHFAYEAEAPTSVVLSMTYFPRWRARLDGQPLTIENHEHLMLLHLPAGTHEVQLRYAPFGSSPARAALALSGVFLLLTAGSAWLLQRYPMLSYADRNMILRTGCRLKPNCKSRQTQNLPPVRPVASAWPGCKPPTPAPIPLACWSAPSAALASRTRRSPIWKTA
ncbi:MAG: hypothetical protein HC915_13055 [Anaerolineae bacterium]|nr:hypothetical protein [Anaerolineae bacterium]